MENSEDFHLFTSFLSFETFNRVFLLLQTLVSLCESSHKGIVFSSTLHREVFVCDVQQINHQSILWKSSKQIAEDAKSFAVGISPIVNAIVVKLILKRY